MARKSVGLTLALLVAPTGALAQQATDTWDTEARLDVAGQANRTTPLGKPGPISFADQLAPQLTGTYFLTSLIDESEGALALLRFYQHPGSLAVSVNNDENYARQSGSFHNTHRQLGLTATATVFPWDETGLVASGGMSYAGVSGADRGGATIDYTAGVLHYFKPNLRGTLEYVGSVSQRTQTVTSSHSPALSTLTSAANAGRATGEGIFLQDRLGLTVSLTLGQLTNDDAVDSLTGLTLPGSFVKGLGYGADAAATGYIGHRLSATLEVGAAGQVLSTKDDGGAAGTSSTNQVAPYLSPTLNYFFLDGLWGQLTYKLTDVHDVATGAPSYSEVEHRVTATLAARF